MNWHKILKKTASIALMSIAFAIIEFLISLLIVKYLKTNLANTMGGMSLVIIAFGAFAFVQGNPFAGSTGTNNLGNSGSQYNSNFNIQVAQSERETTNYHRNFLKHNIVSFKVSNLNIMCSGIILLVWSLFI